MKETSQGGAGMWDSHIRSVAFFLYNKYRANCLLSDLEEVISFSHLLETVQSIDLGEIAAGTNLEAATCPSGSDNAACMAAFLALHLTPASTAYLEVSTHNIASFSCH